MTKTIFLRGNNHFFEELNADRREAILLVHGHPFDHTMWRYQHDALNRFRLILPDLKGYGQTDYRFDKIYIEEHALDLAFLLDEIGIDRVHLIGLSMGGQIVVEFARLFPHRTLSLVVCDTSPAAETEASYHNRLELIQRMLTIGMTKYTQEDIHKYLHPATIRDRKDVYDHLFQMMTRTHIEGAVASHRGRAERRDNLGYQKKISIPALFVVGDQDSFTPAAEMKDLAARVQGSKLVVIEEAGHMPNMEQPEKFNRVINEFYDRISA